MLLTTAVGIVAIGVTFELARRLRRVQRLLDEQQANARASTEARARLIWGVSQNFRNPLNSIVGHSHLLLGGFRGEISSDHRDSISRIEGAARALIRLSSDFLNLSLMEADSLRVVAKALDLTALVEQVAEEHKTSAAVRGQCVSVVTAQTLPVIVTDAEKVRHILGNLLSNAVRYARDSGKIDIRVQVANTRISPESPEDTFAQVSVVDDGPGIPPRNLEQVFEFCRVEHAGRMPGTGIGLTVARRLARLLGGDIRAANHRESGGAVLMLLLPFRFEAPSSVEAAG